MNIPEVKMRIQALDALASRQFAVNNMKDLSDEDKAEYQKRLFIYMFEHIAALTKAVQE